MPEAGRQGELVERNDGLTRAARDFYLRIIEHFPVLVWRAGPDGGCDYFNHTWLEFTGRSLEQELGDGWADGVHPDDRDRVVAGYFEAFNDRREVVLEYRLRRHDGAYRWLYDLGQPFSDVDDEFAGYIGACYDITDRHQAIERVRAAEETKTLLLQTISHDLRSPVAIASAAIAQLRTMELPEDASRLAGIAGRQVARASELAETMLALDWIDRGAVTPRPQVVELAELVGRVVGRIDTASHDLRVEASGMCRLDPVLIERILDNLVVNAIRHTPPGTQIRVQASVGEDGCLIAVHDGGPGVPARIKDTSPTSGGPSATVATGADFGLGLTLVMRYAQIHGAHLEITDSPMGGAAFELLIPN